MKDQDQDEVEAVIEQRNRILANLERIEKAAEHVDWLQVLLHGGSPCFHICDDGRFCNRAERWVGHEDLHKFVSLAELIKKIKSS